MALYATRGGNNSSDLYTINPSTGAATSVGPTGHAITGLAFHPGTGVLYGTTTGNSPAHPTHLVTVNKTTGAVTDIGALGLGAGITLADIAFKSDGTLYGLSVGRKLCTVNLATGAATAVSGANLPAVSGFGFGCDFDGADTLMVCPDGTGRTGFPTNGRYYLADLIAGIATDTPLSQNEQGVLGVGHYDDNAAISAGAFGPPAVFYALENDFGSGNVYLLTIDTLTGATTVVGDTGIVQLDALASDARATEAADFPYPPPICFLATDILNPDSPTASVVSGRVREVLTLYDGDGVSPELQPEPALKFTWTDGPGLYRVTARGRPAATPNATGTGRVLVTVDGRPIYPIQSKGSASAGVDVTWTQYPGLSGAGGTYDPGADTADAPWVPLTEGTVVEVFVLAERNAFDIQQVCFQKDNSAPASSYSTTVYGFDAKPLGDVWGSLMGWGGQWLIPDEIYANLGVTRYDESIFNPWATRLLDYDFVPLESGVVYAIVAESYGPFGAHTSKYYVALKKYDPATDTWSQIETLNVNPPANLMPAEAVSCEYDGTYVYLVWWEMDTYFGPNYPNGLWKWHCKRLDPSDDSVVELGSGQHAFPATTVGNYPGSTLASAIAAPGNGDVYVAATECEETHVDNRLSVWRWNGSSWSDLSVPAPSVQIHPRWNVSGENGFWDRLSALVCARDGEGPVDDGFTLAYSYFDNAGFGSGESRLVTRPYTVGSGWGAEILSAAGAVEGGRLTAQAEFPGTPDTRWEWFDLDILWSPKYEKLLLVTDFFYSNSAEEIWDVLKMNDAGTQWEPLNPLVPASVVGDWNETRNTAVVGPDGEVYAARATTLSGSGSTAVDSFFDPKLFKTSDGYLGGFSVAGAPAWGEVTNTGLPWMTFIDGTAHYRIRFAGQVPYVMNNLFPNEIEADFVSYTGAYGEGLYITRLSAKGGIVSFNGISFPARRGRLKMSR